MDVLTNTRASNRYMGEIWALVCRSMAMCVRAMLLCSFIVAFVALVDVPEASAQEKYAGVALQPNGWIMRQMKTFSGSAPSRAWIFGRKKNVAAEGQGIEDDAPTGRMPGTDLDRTKPDNGDADAEVFASILVTEGIVGGVRPQKQSALLKLYVESMIQAWGGTSRDDGMTTDEILDDDSGRDMSRRAGILIAAGNAAQADDLGQSGTRSMVRIWGKQANRMDLMGTITDLMHRMWWHFAGATPRIASVCRLGRCRIHTMVAW